MGNILGYLRETHTSHPYSVQLEALELAGCEPIYKDGAGRDADSYVGLGELLQDVRPGDEVVVYDIGRIGRSYDHLQSLIKRSTDEGWSIRSLSEPFNTAKMDKRLLYTLLGVFNDFERTLINERIRDGIMLSKQKGVKLGHRYKLSPEQMQQLVAMYRSKEYTVAAICDQFKVSPATVYNLVNKHRAGL